jgi:hypothetical protein
MEELQACALQFQLMQILKLHGTAQSVQGQATGWTARVRFPAVQDFSLLPASRPTPGTTQPPIQWLAEALSPGVKQPEREADHLPPTSAEVKNTWIYTSTPHTSSWRRA